VNALAYGQISSKRALETLNFFSGCCYYYYYYY